MEVLIYPPMSTVSVDRGWVISMVIKSFKGRRDVEVHLFRPDYDPEEAKAYDWVRLIGDPVSPGASDDPTSARQILLETQMHEPVAPEARTPRSHTWKGSRPERCRCNGQLLCR